MKKNFARLKAIIILIVVVIDTLFYMAFNFHYFKVFFTGNILVNLLFWSIPLLLSTGLLFMRFNPELREPSKLKWLYSLAGFFLTVYLPKIVFILFFIISKTVQVLIDFILKTVTFLLHIETRLPDLDLISDIGIILAIFMFFAMLYGIIIGRFHFKVNNIKLSFKDLPVSFNGIKLVHISDIHLGSWQGKEKQMVKAVNLINSQQPDLILFTGDLVNNFSEEASGWPPILGLMKARYGKYSILGNHDYGDYWDWKDSNEKTRNLEILAEAHDKSGFRLLLNESEIISHDGGEIGISGVENWGKPPFMQYGDLKKAMEGMKPVPFRILLSHDPSHWTEEVYGKTDIQLTLSGHTHGMQFGMILGKMRWSPVKYLYKQWSGLYGHNSQYLYVNHGLGSLGFPGRIGIRPEITVISIYNEFKQDIEKK
ncbi:MAG: metallophosphoesterase [Bacteroidales bacterium]|nr:metallophosphoesterase [Bacteroidales bacterium]